MDLAAHEFGRTALAHRRSTVVRANNVPSRLFLQCEIGKWEPERGDRQRLHALAAIRAGLADLKHARHLTRINAVPVRRALN